jgi:hypothetical protein
MSRQITGFSTGSELNENIGVWATDEPGPGGACHQYLLDVQTLDNGNLNVSETPLKFQKGPVKEHGINGVSDEALLAVIIDRAEGFASGPYSCKENDEALYHLKKALEWKMSRTKERQERGVEGTMAK